MRVLPCVVAVALLSPALAHAHDGEHEHRTTPRRAKFGGLGFMHVGTHVGPVADVASTLREANALGEQATSAQYGYTIGGGGWSLLHRRLVIGGRGFGLFSPRIGSDRGTAEITAGGGGFQLGVAAVNRDPWILIPYVGGGGGGISMEITNRSDAAVTIADDEPIPSEGQRRYDAGFGYLEFGMMAHRLLFFGSGGFAVGFNVGGMVSVVASEWNTGERTLEGVDRPRLSGGFFRITLGGGGFHFEE